MAGVRIKVNVNGSTRLTERWNRRVNFLGGPVMGQLLSEMGKDMEDQFRRNVDRFTPGRVRDLSKRYKTAKARQVGHVYPILIATGMMLGSMYSRVGRREGWVVRVGFAGQHYSGMTNQRLVAIHTGNEPSDMPVRDFLKLTPKFTQRWRKKILSQLHRR